MEEPNTPAVDTNLDAIPRVDLPAAIKLHFTHNLKQSDIAKLQGVTRQAIDQALRPYKQFFKDNNVTEYQSIKADMFEAAEMQLLKDVIDKQRRKKASLNNVAYALGQVNNVKRLETGQSTANIQIVSTNYGESKTPGIPGNGGAGG